MPGTGSYLDVVGDADRRSNVFLFEVGVFIRSTWKRPLFTGKLVKSFLIDSEPSIKTFFERIRGVMPKLVHVSPLYTYVGNKLVCVYSHADVDERGNLSKVHPVSVNGSYTFYVGFVEVDVVAAPRFDQVYAALTNISGRHRFAGTEFDVELVSLRTVDVVREAESVVEGLLRSGKLRFVFSSPTMLRDPFRSSKFKSLIPTPMNVFSTSTYIHTWLAGKLHRKTYYGTLLAVHRLLNETHSIYPKRRSEGTVRVRHIFYENGKKPVPAIIGYVNYRLNHNYLEKYARRIDAEELLTTLLKYILSLGTGTSRATGFGHIKTTTDPTLTKPPNTKGTHTNTSHQNSTRNCLNSGGVLKVPHEPSGNSMKNINSTHA